jgi:hypothetical protein
VPLDRQGRYINEVNQMLYKDSLRKIMSFSYVTIKAFIFVHFVTYFDSSRLKTTEKVNETKIHFPRLL